MSRRVLLAALAVGATLFGASTAAADPAAQLRPINLRVSDSDGPWQAEQVFRLAWDRPPVAAEFPVSAVGYRVRDASGAMVVAETRVPTDVTAVGIEVPRWPGIYTADLWLEGPGGARGPTVSTTLRFDDVRPGTVRPLAPAGWIAGNAAVEVRVEHPAGSQPVSGIRGYAITVDGGSGRMPCAGRDRCSVAETDLGGGIDDDTASLGFLPEGVSVVHAVAVSGAGLSSAEVGSATVRVDATRPTVSLTGAPRGWTDGPVRLVAAAADHLSGMAAAGPTGPYTAIAVDGSVPRAEPGDTAAITVSGEGAHVVVAFARDAAGNVDSEGAARAPVAIDESPPRVAFARAQDPAEPELIEATVADSLSGPNPARGSIAARPLGSRQRWQPLPTTVAAGRLLATWDSDSFPPGSYEFRATGYDAAGNAAASNRRGNGVRMILANPLKIQTRIAAGFGGHGAAARWVIYGHGAVYRGRLTTAAGTPLGGAPVTVVEAFDAGSDLSERVTTVATAADGSFRIRLTPGPSRRVEARFGGNRTLARTSGGRARMQVGAGVSLRASVATARVGGPPVTFSGRVGELGATPPPGGVAVELQFRLPRRPWSEFRTVQTDAHGVFRYAYAFSDDDSRGVRFQFRAFVNGGDWPYEPAASKPVPVSGR
jgi:hypothetical protein